MNKLLKNKITLGYTSRGDEINFYYPDFSFGNFYILGSSIKDRSRYVKYLIKYLLEHDMHLDIPEVRFYTSTNEFVPLVKDNTSTKTLVKDTNDFYKDLREIRDIYLRNKESIFEYGEDYQLPQTIVVVDDFYKLFESNRTRTISFLEDIKEYSKYSVYFIICSSRYFSEFFDDNFDLGNHLLEPLENIQNKVYLGGCSEDHEDDFIGRVIGLHEERNFAHISNEFVYSTIVRVPYAKKKKKILSDKDLKFDEKISRITIKDLFGVHSYSIDVNKDTDAVILFGLNGVGKTTIFSILYEVLSADINKFDYLLDRVQFTYFNIEFKNGSKIELYKSDKLNINYCHPTKTIASLSFELGNIDNEKIYKHFENLNKFFDVLTLEKDNFLFVKTNRLFSEESAAHLLSRHFIIIPEIKHADLSYRSILKILYGAKSVFDDIKDKLNAVFNNIFLYCLYNNNKKVNYISSDIYNEFKEEYDFYHQFMPPIYFGKAKSAPILRSYFLELRELKLKYDDFKYLFENFYEDNKTKKTIELIKNNELSVELKLYSSDNKELKFEHLSSGEKQLVLVLHQLLFKISKCSIVLIDEPEISLHVLWQKWLLDSVLYISNKYNIQPLIASHSPFIAAGHDDLVVEIQESDK